MKTLVDSITHWDAVLVESILRWSSRRVLYRFFSLISHTGNGYYYPLLAALLLLVEPAAGMNFLMAGLAAFAIELPLYKVIKNGVKRIRPYEAIANVQPLVDPIDRFSFPSGHTAAAFVVATLLAHLFPPLGLPVFAWAGSVAFSRVYLGVHYLTDIAAGMLLGILSAASALMLLQ